MTLDSAFGVFREDRGILRRMIVFSLLLHIFTLSLFFLTLKNSSPKLALGSNYAVNLVSAADLRMNSASRPAETPKEPANPPVPEKKVIQKKEDSLSSIPIRKADAKKADKSVEKAIEKIRKKVDAMSKKESSSLAYSASGKASDMPVGGPSGTLSDAELSVKWKIYYGAVSARVKRYWSVPPDLLPKKNILTVINVRISRGGAVEVIGFEKRSGNNYYDESAMRAVRKASPFPPLPAGLGNEIIEMGINFNSSELQ
jgi:TonB family protein